MTRCPFTREECSSADKCSPPVTPLFVPVDPLAEQEQNAGPSLFGPLLDEIRKEPRTSVALLSIVGAIFLPRWERPLLRIASELLRKENEEQAKKVGAP
jgi:hypothetical protein